ncbi:hypothetical protein F2Q70_00001456 [Brassica cretica]|uniref:Uncharacterized protein n=1 Tax=Brassica cretica TaxID=69181 RepID=A0A8S9IQS3_BRACR|nr:hypothetical protein F2Q70_00001456 [Brassica cretica]
MLSPVELADLRLATVAERKPSIIWKEESQRVATPDEPTPRRQRNKHHLESKADMVQP